MIYPLISNHLLWEKISSFNFFHVILFTDGRSWNQQKTYSYSYADPGRGSQSPSTAEYQNTSQRQNGLMGNSRHGNTGNPRQGKGGNVQSTGLHGSRYI